MTTPVVRHVRKRVLGVSTSAKALPAMLSSCVTAPPRAGTSSCVAGLPPRYLTGVAFDKHRNVLVVFGGGDPSSDRLFDDLWELDASSWHEAHLIREGGSTRSD